LKRITDDVATTAIGPIDEFAVVRLTPRSATAHEGPAGAAWDSEVDAEARWAGCSSGRTPQETIRR
jgi:hypothetical protein